MNDIHMSPTHSFSSKAREGMKISGVSDVVSFDDRSIVLETSCGGMGIEGEDLHITTLNIAEGLVDVEGRINGLYYFEERPVQKRRLFSRGADSR